MGRFIKAEQKTFTQPVQIIIGGKVEQEFEVKFKYVSPKDYDEFVTQQNQCKNVDAISQIVAGWSGLKDADGNDVLFSYEAIGELLDDCWLFNTLVQAWTSGLQGARQKN